MICNANNDTCMRTISIVSLAVSFVSLAVSFVSLAMIGYVPLQLWYDAFNSTQYFLPFKWSALINFARFICSYEGNLISPFGSKHSALKNYYNQPFYCDTCSRNKSFLVLINFYQNFCLVILNSFNLNHGCCCFFDGSRQSAPGEWTMFNSSLLSALTPPLPHSPSTLIAWSHSITQWV